MCMWFSERIQLFVSFGKISAVTLNDWLPVLLALTCDDIREFFHFLATASFTASQDGNVYHLSLLYDWFFPCFHRFLVYENYERHIRVEGIPAAARKEYSWHLSRSLSLGGNVVARYFVFLFFKDSLDTQVWVSMYQKEEKEKPPGYCRFFARFFLSIHLVLSKCDC